MPIDPSFATTGGEWAIGGPGPLGPAAPAPAEGGSDFSGALAEQLGSLADVQTDAARASGELAMGTAADPTEAVLAVERARLAMSFAAQIRTKVTEAVNDVMHTQV